MTDLMEREAYAPEFKDFGKISRFRTSEALVTEKIDGSNAQILVPDDPTLPVLAGSRNRWVWPGPKSDNFGFASFVAEHAEAFRRLGPGRHFGEWWGAGIGRRYGQTGKLFSLFNVDRYERTGGLPQGLPDNVDLVPVLYRGPMDTNKIQEVIDGLYKNGSVRVPGWDKPEGVIIQLAGMRWKVTDNGDAHKGQAAE